MKNQLVGASAAPRKRIAPGRVGTVIATTIVGTSTFVAVPAFAQSGNAMRQLIEVMHQNGSISDAQYNRLMAAAAHDNSTQATPASAGQQPLAHSNAGTENNDETTGSGTGFPKKIEDQFKSLAWAQKVKLTGDLRLRYEYNSNNDALATALGEQPDNQTDNRSRGRVRYRLGIITNPIDHLEVGAGLASGGDNPRSTNQTFTGNFSSKGIRLDYAYGQYDFSSLLPEGYKLTAIGGKFKFGKYLWHPTDAMWDGDINPEGGSIHLARQSSLGETFANSGIWVIQENSGSNQDPYLWYVQAGQHFKLTRFFASLSGTYYGFEDTYTGAAAPDTVFEYGSGTNTTSQFSVVDIDGTIGTEFENGRVAFIGQYLKNTHSDVNMTTGYALGVKASSGPWGLKYLYVDLDRNVVPDAYPDSDRFNGATGMKGNEVALSYTLNDAIEFGVDYYNTQAKFGPSQGNQNLVQTDIEFSF